MMIRFLTVGQWQMRGSAAGPVDTELAGHLRDDIREATRSQTATIEPLRPGDIADTVAYIVTRDRRVAVNEMLVRAAEQTW
jgi:NADP-dependent 3-hydroxy acid dehydrogenase YdfG